MGPRDAFLSVAKSNSKREMEAMGAALPRRESGSSGVKAWLEPGARGAHLAPSDSPSYLIWRLSTVLSRRYNRDYAASVGMGTPHVRLITLVVSSGPISFKALVSQSGMDKGQVSRTLADLIERGYIALDGPDRDANRFTTRSRERSRAS